MLLSLVIPSKNEAKYISSLLKSIINHDADIHSNIELILADNQSTDKTVEVFEAICNEYSLRYQVVKGGLPAVGRNNGAKVAKGDYLLFVDADTILSERFLNSVFAELAGSERKLLYVPIYHAYKYTWPYESMWILINFLTNTKLLGNLAVGVSIIVSKKAFASVGGFNETVSTHEDVDLARKFKKVECSVLGAEVFASNRRFERDGYWKTFLMYSWVFLKSLAGKEYNSRLSTNYFDSSF